MKMQIVGVEASEGASKKDGKAYAIGQLHTLAQLAPARAGQTARGFMGTTYRCDVNLIKSIAHLAFPVIAEVELQAQMMFGKREDVVVDIKPTEVTRKAA